MELACNLDLVFVLFKLYFFAFAVLTGNMAYLEIRTWLSGKVVDSSDDPVGGNYSSNSAASRDADARREGTDSSLEDINDNLDGTKFATTQAPPLCKHLDLPS